MISENQNFTNAAVITIIAHFFLKVTISLCLHTFAILLLFWGNGH